MKQTPSYMDKMVNYRRYLFFFLFIFSALLTLGQEYKVKLNLKVIPDTHPNDSIFISGNFNDWDPHILNYQITNFDKTFSVEVGAKKGEAIECKFTRGSWGNEEVYANGKIRENRVLHISSDTTIDIAIEGWKDDFDRSEKKHTMSEQVHIVDTAFFIPQLNRVRKVWIYLPEGYSKSKNKKRYPVLYLQDGQNIFDEYNACCGEWGVDEILDSLIQNKKPAAIVVGIESGPERLKEYNPYYFEKSGEGEGNQYVQFLVKTLKPFIDKHYRTLSQKEHTIIGGSSMGALISYYAILKYPNVFGAAGLFSPAFWIAPEIKQLAETSGSAVTDKVFFYIGGLEGDSYVTDMKEIADGLGKYSNAIIYSVIDPEGKHNENAWRKWFSEFYCWIMGDGFNNQVNIEK